MRVLVGGFSIESNSFVPSETTQADFERQVWAVGDHVTRDCAGTSSELAGAWDALTEAGIEIVGSIVAAASPGAPVVRDVYESVCDQVLGRCDDDVDGVYLMLHGSALVDGLDDPEGVLLSRVRSRVGQRIPIAISLDLHAYLTDEMMANSSIVTAYRTCPHIDLYRTGHQAGEILARAVKGEVDPVSCHVRLPMVTPPERHDSSQDLFRGLQLLCSEAEEQGALAAALLCVQPWLDVPQLGWSAVVTYDANAPAARAAAESIAERAWLARRGFLKTSEVDISEALSIALQSPGLFVVADMGDATNGGSLGDSTELLRALLQRRELGLPTGPSALTIVDPQAVVDAERAGVDAIVDLYIGSGSSGAFNETTHVQGVVSRVWHAPMTYTHPAARGVVDDPGRAALVCVDDMYVILHSRPVRVIDPAIYVSAEVDIDGLRMVQAKSHVSFRAGFEGHAVGSVLADTKGPTAANLAFLPFSRIPNPLFPLQECEWSVRGSNEERCDGR